MAFWSTETLKSRIPVLGIIEPFQEDRVINCSYELSLGPDAFVSSISKKKQTLNESEHLVIPSGHIALLITEEKVKIPNNAIGFISMKASIKLLGLVNISGFHVDPGFEGKLKYSVYNAGPKDVILERGKPLFPMWLSDLDQSTSSPYAGIHGNQSSLLPKDIMDIKGQVHSPGSLDVRLIAIERQFSIIKIVAIPLIIAILAGMFIAYFISDRQYLPDEINIVIKEKMERLGESNTNVRENNRGIKQPSAPLIEMEIENSEPEAENNEPPVENEN